MRVLLPLISRKLNGMALLLTSIHTVFLHRKTSHFFFPLLPHSSPFWPECSNYKPGSLPRRKKWFGKDAKHLLLLTEVLKSTKPTSQPLDMPLPSSPKPRLQGMLTSPLNLILNQSTLSSTMLLVLVIPLPLPFLTALLPGNGISICQLSEISLFCLSAKCIV